MPLRTILTFLLCFIFSANAQWKIIRTSQPDKNLSSLYFCNADTGWAVGNTGSLGLILKTTDGGFTWNYQYFNLGSLSSIHFVSEFVGLTVGSSNTILRTSDGGESWQATALTNINNFYRFWKVFCVNDSIHWVYGEKRILIDPFTVKRIGFMVYTTDGGSSWIETQNLNIENSDSRYSSLFFRDQNVGYVSSSNRIYSTTDGGINWTFTIFPENLYPRSLSFLTESNWWSTTSVNNSARIYKTTNAGNNWEVKFFLSSATVPHIFSLFFWDDDRGWAVGNRFWGGHTINQELILSTTNSGETWNQQYVSLNGQLHVLKEKLETVQFVSSQIGYILVQDGAVLKTLNGGIGMPNRNPNNFNCLTPNGKTSNPTPAFCWQENGDPDNDSLMYTLQIYRDNQYTNLFREVDLPENCYTLTPPLTEPGWYYYRIRALDGRGGYNFGFNYFMFELPNVFTLNQNYPNPFNTRTIITYDLPEGTMVNLTIYDLQGKPVKTLVNEEQVPGSWEIPWNGDNETGGTVSAGTYFYVLKAGEFSRTKKMVFLK